MYFIFILPVKIKNKLQILDEVPFSLVHHSVFFLIQVNENKYKTRYPFSFPSTPSISYKLIDIYFYIKITLFSSPHFPYLSGYR